MEWQKVPMSPDAEIRMNSLGIYFQRPLPASVDRAAMDRIIEETPEKSQMADRHALEYIREILENEGRLR